LYRLTNHNPPTFCKSRALNNFPAGAGQIVWSNLFLLRHTPFLAGQTVITSYHYKSAPSPLRMMFKYETSKFSKHFIVHEHRSQCRKNGTHGTAKSLSHLCENLQQ